MDIVIRLKNKSKVYFISLVQLHLWNIILYMFSSIWYRFQLITAVG